MGQKDVTWIKNERNLNNEVLIFEFFFDYLTYRNMEKEEKSTSNHLILNSTAMFFKVKNKIHDIISLFPDNNPNGKAITEMIQNDYDNVEDCLILYNDFKDFHEWWLKNLTGFQCF